MFTRIFKCQGTFYIWKYFQDVDMMIHHNVIAFVHISTKYLCTTHDNTNINDNCNKWFLVKMRNLKVTILQLRNWPSCDIFWDILYPIIGDVASI